MTITYNPKKFSRQRKNYYFNFNLDTDLPQFLNCYNILN